MENTLQDFYNKVAKNSLLESTNFNYVNGIQYLVLFKQKTGKRIVGITNNGEWIVETNVESFILKDKVSLFKLMSLLEIPFSEIENQILTKYKYLLGKYDVRNIFPFFEIIEYVFLNLPSLYWFELAYIWFMMLSVSQKMRLIPLLEEIIVNKKLTQPLRQKIAKQLNSIKE